jgi:Flp pilus assembly protein TadG
MIEKAARKAKMAISERKLAGDEGSALVEAALSCSILLPILFGIIQMSLALYCHSFAADAAREGSRWAMVRGANCTGNISSAYCSPTSSNTDGADGTDISTYVKGLGYPMSGKVTVSTQWCTNGGSTPATWTTCSTTKTGNNSVGNLVQVTVTYPYPLVIPFVPTNTININSTSSMAIVQ